MIVNSDAGVFLEEPDAACFFALRELVSYQSCFIAKGPERLALRPSSRPERNCSNCKWKEAAMRLIALSVVLSLYAATALAAGSSCKDAAGDKKLAGGRPEEVHEDV